jgi:hypothetical protein
MKPISRREFMKYTVGGSALLFFPQWLLNCTSIRTQPNQPYKGPYPESYKKLAQIHPLIGTEIGKLPEIQDGISPKDESTLENLVKLYDSNPTKFNNAFQQMYHEGKPEHRKYCTPLRYLFNLAEENDLSDLSELIKEYDIYDFMNTAWDEIEPPKDLDIITSELNSPELLDVYQHLFFEYISDGEIDSAQYPKETFERKGGDCEDFAIFTAYCLEKGGYNALVNNLYNNEIREGHAVCTYIYEGELWVLDNGTRRRFVQTGIRGPFKSQIEIGRIFAKERGYRPTHIYVEDWNTFLQNTGQHTSIDSLI